MINWKVRIKNPVFWSQIFIAIFAPILAYLGLTASDITSWTALKDVLISAISNPYVLLMVVVSVYNAITDPTTKGIGDSKQALEYTTPKKE